MKLSKRILSILLALIIAMSIVSIGVEAASISATSSNYGYMVPTDSKFNKTLSSVKLYGTYDYFNFYIDSEYDNKYFFYEIYSDKNYTKYVTGDYVYCEDSGEYTWSPYIKLKGVFKSGTYYCITYAASIDSNGNAKVSTPSATEFKLVVDRTTAFAKQVVLLKSVTNTVNGPKITWYKHSSAASKYAIYRRSINGTKWTKVGTVNASTLTFTDKSVKDKNGKYVYTVKALNKKGAGSRYQFSGLTALYAKTPVITSVATSADNKIKVQWKSTSSSAYYEVYRREVGQSSWTKLSGNCKNAYFNDAKAVNGKTYEYTVRANINTAQGKARSAYYGNADKAVKFLQAPVINEIVTAENGLNISWNAVSGASAYTVYRKPLDKSTGWVNLKKVSSKTTSFIDTTASIEDGEYIYTVRVEGSKGRGSYNNSGRVYLKLDTPVLEVKADEGTDRVTLEWNTVDNATSYDIYSKNASGEWVCIYEDATSPLKVTPDILGENEYAVAAKYTYKDALNKKTYTITSDFAEGSTAFTFYPDFGSVYISGMAGGGVDIFWDYCNWASKINIYRKLEAEDDSALQLVATVAGSDSYVDTEAQSGESYTYVIKCVYKGEELPVESHRETITVG